MKKQLAVLIILLLVVFSFTPPVFFTSNGDNLLTKGTIEEVLHLVQKHYYRTDSISKETLIEGAIRGMLHNLDDPYNSFFTPTEYEQWRTELQGKFTGIGLKITKRDSYIEVVTPLSNTPASRAGIKSGYIILGIDGDSTLLMTLNEVKSKIRGEPGSIVRLKMLTTSDKIVELTLTRTDLHLRAVEHQLLAKSNIGYIRINIFNDEAVPQFELALNTLLDSQPKGLIIDLRDNPGGLLAPVIKIGSKLIDNGLIALVKRRARTEQYSSNGNKLPNLPLVLLVNRGTASAAEILAGAVQDHNAGILVGRKTFGKGLIQKTYILKGGQKIKLTIGEYFTPHYRQVENKGLEPDLVVDSRNQDLQTAIQKILSLANKKTYSQQRNGIL